ncbi:hypothetical protein Tco_0833414 [Tanacetum coccineum]
MLASRQEDPYSTHSLSCKLGTGGMGRIDSLETELGTSKKIMGGAILTLVSRVKKLERTVKQLKTARFGGDAPATEGDVNIQDDVDLEGLSRMASEALGHDQPAVPSEHMEEREEEEVPLRRKRSVYRRARTEFNTSAFAQFYAPLSCDVLPQATISESAGSSRSKATFRRRTASEGALGLKLRRAEDLAKERHYQMFSKSVAKELDHTNTGVPPAVSYPHNMQMNLNLLLEVVAFNLLAANGFCWFTTMRVEFSPFADSDNSSSPSPVSTDHIPN